MVCVTFWPGSGSGVALVAGRVMGMATRPNKNMASTTTKAGDSGSDAAGETTNRL